MDTKEKSVQLFTYLKELSALRTKQVKNINNYEEVLWFSDIPKLANCYCVAWSLWAEAVDDKERRRDVWIEVHKPKLKSPPEVPDDLEPWIKEEEVFDSSVEEPGLLDEIIVLSELEGEERTNVLSINEHPEIIDAWVDYSESKWKPWAEEDRRLQQIQRVYNDLFTIYQRAEKLGEQYEVVIGAGYLIWQSSNSGEIRHPIATFQSRVEFDRVRGIISVYAAFNGPQPKLEIDMLETSDRPGVSDLQAIIQMVDELNGNPWDGPALEAIFKSFANGISTESIYENSITKPTQISNAPQLHFAPSLILRRRTRRTFVDYYQGIIDQIMENSKIPESVRRLVEIVEYDTVPEEPIPVQDPSNIEIKDSELYFPLKANDEQKRIAQRIEQQRGVLVQGPPGTGKSHTITNLVSHFLAKGQRVLVTSETPRALEVLRKMLPEEIRELCVVWLGAGPEAQKSLEKSVNGITQKKVNWESSSANKEILDLEKRLDEVRREQERLRKNLTAFREADTYQHINIFNKYSGTLEKIAIKAKAEQYQYGWFLDRPHSDAKSQVTATELGKMIQIHRQLTDEVLREIRMRHSSSRQADCATKI